MEQKIFLEENNSMKSVNASARLDVGLEAETRLIPHTDAEDTISLFKQYNKERDNSTKYRLIFTVNPICSNVLFNARTEIVYHEGHVGNTKLFVGKQSESIKDTVNNTPLDWKQGLRDTEYSHQDIFSGCVYHCGYDIFNNHMLRADDFVHINAIKQQNGTYNTLQDYLRNSKGDIIKEVTAVTGNTENDRHLYQVDSVLSMEEAFVNKCIEKDGWFGFNNPSFISIDNGLVKSPKNLNRLLNNNKPCEFIDLYPDRSLFSMLPIKNKWAKRYEYNWDCAISYPFESDTDKFNEIMGLEEFPDGSNKVAAVKVLDCEVQGDYVKMTPIFRHTLKTNDYVTIFYMKDGILKRAPLKVRVSGIGDSEGHDKNRIFSVRLNELSFFAEDYKGTLVYRGSTSHTKLQLYYKKNANNTDCQYYFRKFRTINGLKNDITKLGFGENIYGDRLAQVVFTDPIDIAGLTDNLGRPLTELYFTMVKTNRGHELWYSYSGGSNNASTVGSEEVEVSHCFGKVTSGLDLPVSQKDYNVRRLHNIDFTNISGGYKRMTDMVFTSLIGGNPKPLEDDITMDKMRTENGFYGDVVEFNPVEYTETVIENVYHRFNTEQRETTNSVYYDILRDELQSDDFDPQGFKVVSGFVNSTYEITNPNNTGFFAGNLSPEGYYYNPMVKIKLRDVSEVVQSEEAIFINCVHSAATFERNIYDTYTTALNDPIPVKDEDGNIKYYDLITFDAPSTQSMYASGTIAFFDKVTQKTSWGILDKIEGNTIFVKTEPGLIDENNFKDNGYMVNYLSPSCPKYAAYVMNNQTYVWRDYVKPSEETSESDLITMPFANDSFYIHSNINFFVRRQDPRNEFGLRNPDEITTIDSRPRAANTLSSFKFSGWDAIDFSGIEFIIDALNNICY